MSRSVQTRSKDLCMSIELDSYMKSALVPHAPTIDFASMSEATEFYDGSCNYIVLVDPGVRLVEELEEFTLPFWSTFKKKMAKQKKDFNMDKFLYSYNIATMSSTTKKKKEGKGKALLL